MAEIIDLSQSNKLFGADLKDTDETHVESTEMASEGDDFIKELTGFGYSARKVMESSCDFAFEDIKQLTPSEVKVIFDSWKEVNQTFLNFLNQMGLIEAAKKILEKAISDFSKMLAI